MSCANNKRNSHLQRALSSTWRIDFEQIATRTSGALARSGYFFLYCTRHWSYAINIEMTPQALQHGPLEADQDLVEIEHGPIRQAIRQKYVRRQTALRG